MTEIEWDSKAQEVFDKVVGNLPQFHRSIAQRLVKVSAEDIARSKNSAYVEVPDLVTAFFQEVPPAFKDMMKRLFHNLDINYSLYVDE